MPLSIIIVGGGISGLTTALYLRPHTLIHSITVLERTTLEFNTNDYGLSLVSNAYNLLLKAGINESALDAVPLKYIWYRDSQNGEIQTVDFEGKRGPSILASRAKIQAELYRLATSEEREGKPARVVRNAKVVRVDVSEGAVWTEDGTKYEGDLIIGADGIASYVRAAILDTTNGNASGTTAEPSAGVTHDLLAFMTSMPLSTIRTSPALSFLSTPNTAGGMVFWRSQHEHDRKRLLAYHSSPQTLQVLAYTSEQEFTALFDSQKASIIKNIPMDRVRRDFEAEFSQDVLRLFEYADGGIDAWRIRDVEPLDHWVKGKAVVIGDAAHAVTPHAGQGSNISIEDAEALGYLFKDVTSPTQIPGALDKFVRLRKERTHLVARYSRQIGGVMGAGCEMIDRGMFQAKIYGYAGAEDALKADA